MQTRAQAGYRAPQDPSTWPKEPRAVFVSGRKADSVRTSPALQADGDNQWTIAGGWQMVAAPKITASAQEIAKAGFDSKDWLAATVPGTALTTMIDRGIYPDSDYGLNNLVIPETLNKQDYWYRNEFKAPKTPSGRRFTLTLLRNQLRRRGVAEWAIARQHQGRIHSRRVRCDRRAQAGTDECTGGARFAAAASRHSARTVGARRTWRERRHDVSRRAHVCCDRGMGLDSRDSRPRHRHLAAGHA